MGKGARRPLWRAARERRVYVRYSAELAVRICERVAAGELIYRLAQEEGMPTPEAVAKWAKEKPDFGEALLAARAAGGRPAGARGQPFSYCAATADAMLERLCEGESLTRIGADPTMPSLSTIFYWRRRIPEFEAAVRLGQEIQAQRFCDLGWEIAEAATPETAYVTKVKLEQLRWTAGVQAPRVYRLKAVEAASEPKRTDVLFRKFRIEEDPETGEMKVVAYCPNPETGEVMREGRTSWRPAPHQIPMPGGAIRPPEPGWDD